MNLLRHFGLPALLLLFSATACHKPLYLSERRASHYSIDHTTPDTAMLSMLQPYKAGVDTQMQVVIGRTDIPLTKAQPESTLGNFMADAQMVAARKFDNKVVGSVVNYGGIRISYLAPGPITKRNMYELMPFDNMLTIVEVPGDVLRKFCSHMAKYRGWPVSGISFTIRNKEAENIMIGDASLNDHIVYKIAMSDYIAKGGDQCDFLISLRKRYTTTFLRDAMIDYVMQLDKEGKPLHPVLEKRIQYAE